MIRRPCLAAAVLMLGLTLPSCMQPQYPLDMSMRRPLVVGAEFHESVRSSLLQESDLLGLKGIQSFRTTQELEARGTVLAWNGSRQPSSVRLVVERCVQTKGNVTREVLPAGAVVVASLKDHRMTYEVDGRPASPEVQSALWNLVPRPLGRPDLLDVNMLPFPHTTAGLWAGVNPNLVVPPPVGDLAVNSMHGRRNSEFVRDVRVDGMECQEFVGASNRVLESLEIPPAGGYDAPDPTPGTPAAGRATIQERHRVVVPSEPFLGLREESIEFTLEANWPLPDALERNSNVTVSEHSTVSVSWKYTYPK